MGRTVGQRGSVPSRRDIGQAGVLPRHPAAERDRRPAHGPHVRDGAGRHHDALATHEREERALAAGYRPCRHRHADACGASTSHRGIGPQVARPREVSRARLAMEGDVRRSDRQSAQARRSELRLVPRAIHDGSGSLAGGHRMLRAALRARPGLSRGIPGQLGPGHANRHLGPRGRVRDAEGLALASAVSD